MQLHHPCDEGLDEFWVDFNTATSSMSLYTEDVGALSDGGGGDDMWESIIVKNDVVQEWSVTSEQTARGAWSLVELRGCLINSTTRWLLNVQ